LDIDKRMQAAVQSYWDARAENKEKQVKSGKIDAGTRGDPRICHRAKSHANRLENQSRLNTAQLRVPWPGATKEVDRGRTPAIAVPIRFQSDVTGGFCTSGSENAAES
jgi:hypothetical protein